MIQQQHPSAETERYYSPEEAGEILKLAANLQDNAFSLERLRAIAAEAGISEENLQRAVQLYEQQRKQSLQSRESKVASRRKNFKRLALYLALIVALLAGVMMSISGSRRTLPAPSSSTTTYSSVASGTLVASSEKCEVYKQRKFDESGKRYERVQIRDRITGQSFVVGHQFATVLSASISPTGKYVAIYDEERDEVWVVATDGSNLQRVAPQHGLLIRGINPMAGWSTENGGERLRLRTLGGYTYVSVEK
ncbi:MAG: hypothetical protein RMJ83_01905 [Armatimonadota bacterium]|nr:hypothetical protein [Armatimonadota bacterium]